MTTLPEPGETMKRSIRQRMDVKDTEELLDIYAIQDASSWLPTTFEIIKTILLDRGWSESDLLKEVQDQKKKLEAEDDEFEYLDFSNIDWQNDSADMLYQEFAKIEDLSILTFFSNDEDDLEALAGSGPETFKCIACSNEISWNAEVCPCCGLELYPGHSLAEFMLLKEERLNPKAEEFAAELREMPDDELRQMWLEIDPLDWTSAELKAIHIVFAERKIHLPYLLDAPADLAQRLPYFTEESLNFRGAPGYRLRPGRSGLDYVDLYAELGRIMGTLIKTLFHPKGSIKNFVATFLFLLLSAAAAIAYIDFFSLSDKTLTTVVFLIYAYFTLLISLFLFSLGITHAIYTVVEVLFRDE